MTTAVRIQADDRQVATSISLLSDLSLAGPGPDFAVRFWDGTTWVSRAGTTPEFTLVLEHPGALRSMFLPPNELTLFEAYLYDDFDVEGDIEAFFALLARFIDTEGGMGKLEQFHFGRRLLSLPRATRRRPSKPLLKLRGRRHSRDRDRRAISYHYDQSNEFYELWLDPYMVYTCAYFESPEEPLAIAQERHLDYVCRKLRLAPGERVLDLGCGWGGLGLYAAKHYGVSVDGITISLEQAKFARQRIMEAGLSDRCRIDVVDYRDVQGSERYDKAVAMGLLEHVGASMLDTFFRRVYDLVRPGGAFLNQAIGSRGAPIVVDDSNFFGRYVFPDGDLVPIGQVAQAAEVSGFEVRDVECLREHYPLTLRHWIRGLEQHADEARALVGEQTYRIWRLFMALFAHGFVTGRVTIYQSLFSKPRDGHSALPLSRADWCA